VDFGEQVLPGDIIGGRRETDKHLIARSYTKRKPPGKPRRPTGGLTEAERGESLAKRGPNVAVKGGACAVPQAEPRGRRGGRGPGNAAPQAPSLPPSPPHLVLAGVGQQPALEARRWAVVAREGRQQGGDHLGTVVELFCRLCFLGVVGFAVFVGSG
jgi:hypothetical protein